MLGSPRRSCPAPWRPLGACRADIVAGERIDTRPGPSALWLTWNRPRPVSTQCTASPQRRQQPARVPPRDPDLAAADHPAHRGDQPAGQPFIHSGPVQQVVDVVVGHGSAPARCRWSTILAHRTQAAARTPARRRRPPAAPARTVRARRRPRPVRSCARRGPARPVAGSPASPSGRPRGLQRRCRRRPGDHEIDRARAGTQHPHEHGRRAGTGHARLPGHDRPTAGAPGEHRRALSRGPPTTGRAVGTARGRRPVRTAGPPRPDAARPVRPPSSSCPFNPSAADRSVSWYRVADQFGVRDELVQVAQYGVETGQQALVAGRAGPGTSPTAPRRPGCCPTVAGNSAT